MRRFLYLLFAALTIASSPAISQVSGVSTPGVVSLIGETSIPFILPSSGTVGSNGALSAITALPTSFSTGAYIYMPAGAINSGSAAGWYYYVGSSTTAGTIYNNVYTSGTPTIPASPSSFSGTTGISYTQTTSTNIPSYTLSIAGNTIGAYSAIHIIGALSYINNADTKRVSCYYSTYVFCNVSLTTTVAAGLNTGFSNTGSLSSQSEIGVLSTGSPSTSTTANTYGAINSANAQNLVIELQITTATDFMILQNAYIELLPGV